MYHVGVLALSLDTSATLLRHMGDLGVRANREPPEITMSWAPLSRGAQPWQRVDADTVRSQVVLSSVRLRQAGAHFFVGTDDAAYVPLTGVEHELAIPGLHVVDVVAANVQALGISALGFLGTRWTMPRELYAAALGPMGIATMTLALRDQTTLHSIAFDELAQGQRSFSSRDLVLEFIDDFHRRGCEAVVFGCPGLDALITPANSPLLVLDPTLLLADAALTVAAGEAPLPQWRGGPTSSFAHTRA